jgi:hypothetical protein
MSLLTNLVMDFTLPRRWWRPSEGGLRAAN